MLGSWRNRWNGNQLPAQRGDLRPHQGDRVDHPVETSLGSHKCKRATWTSLHRRGGLRKGRQRRHVGENLGYPEPSLPPHGPTQHRPRVLPGVISTNAPVLGGCGDHYLAILQLGKQGTKGPTGLFCLEKTKLTLKQLSWEDTVLRKRFHNPKQINPSIATTTPEGLHCVNSIPGCSRGTIY